MIYAKKSLGQNFLIDKNIVKKIVNLINVEDKHVIEIGSGKGALTYEIIKKNPKSLLIIEKDNYLANELKSKYSKNKLIRILNEDILKLNLNKIIKKNLLYLETSLTIFHLKY